MDLDEQVIWETIKRFDSQEKCDVIGKGRCSGYVLKIDEDHAAKVYQNLDPSCPKNSSPLENARWEATMNNYVRENSGLRVPKVKALVNHVFPILVMERIKGIKDFYEDLNEDEKETVKRRFQESYSTAEDLGLIRKDNLYGNNPYSTHVEDAYTVDFVQWRIKNDNSLDFSYLNQEYYKGRIPEIDSEMLR